MTVSGRVTLSPNLGVSTFWIMARVLLKIFPLADLMVSLVNKFWAHRTMLSGTRGEAVRSGRHAVLDYL